ncbi:hypothetical protein C2138_04165 [Salinibacterium hongtaonis]|nr:hypothetical protein C2138_04165 [Salinibacterium hongtaonis]
MAIDDIFCEQCGFVSSAVTAAFTGVIPIGPPTPAALSYVVAPPFAAAESSGGEGEPAEAAVPNAEPAVPEVEAAVPNAEPAVPEVEAAVPNAEAAVDDDEPAPFMPAPPTDSRPIPLQPPAGIPVPLPTMPVGVLPSFGLVAPEPSAPAAFAPPSGRGVVSAAAPAFSSDTDKDDADEDDTEVTRIVARKPAAERFVLQFSTGESVSVSGTGLIGRNPKPEPGEFFDHVVRVLDSGRSVSKTHLEFGQERGTFWILDRFSGNGSVVRNPDSEPVRCDPGKRVMVSRGSRVEIGEQFFVVS